MKVEPGQVYHDAFGGRMTTCLLVTRLAFDGTFSLSPSSAVRSSYRSWWALVLVDDNGNREGEQREVLESHLLSYFTRMP